MRTSPRPHQAASLSRVRDLPGWCRFWGLGSGKTFTGLAEAEHLWKKGEVDALLVVAPPSVHEMWVTDELPFHDPDLPWTGHVYHSSRARTKKAQQEWRRMMEEEFPVFVITYQAFRTQRGKKDGPEVWVGKDLVKRFLKKRRCLYVCDESQRVKTPGTKITKMVVASGVYAPYRRALSGTPVTNSPFDVYSQVQFVDPSFWASKGFGSYHSFKTTFGAFKTMRFEKKLKNGKVVEREFQQLLYYKNLDYLGQLLEDISDRCVTEDVEDLPERTFTKRYFEPTGEQKKLYKSLQEDFFAYLDEQEEEFVTAPLAMTRMIDFQQILSGFIKRDAFYGGALHELRENPRLDCLKEILEDLGEEKAIIWARFRYDIDKIMEALGPKAVRFDGQVKDTDRAGALDRFRKDPKCLYFVANPAAGGTGLTLNEAQTTIYYTNSFNLEDRLQSQARNYRIGQTGTVNVIDIVCRGLGIDSKLVTRLRMKFKMASRVMRDEIKEWI